VGGSTGWLSEQGDRFEQVQGWFLHLEIWYGAVKGNHDFQTA
jgi:hypothetical protein